MLNVLIFFITKANVFVFWLICNVMRVALDCGSCLIWEASFNVSFSAKSDISLCFFWRISFQAQAVLSNLLMFCFSDVDVLLCYCKSVCELSVIVFEEFCLLLGFYELLWSVVCQVLSGHNFETILHQTTAFRMSD